MLFRSLFFEANEYKRASDDEKAIATYEKAFALWKDVLKDPTNEKFREDSITLEETYELQLKYGELVVNQRGAQVRQAMVVPDILRLGSGLIGGSPALPVAGLMYGIVTDPRALPLDIKVDGPFDGKDPKGRYWIPTDVQKDVEGRLYPDRQPAPPPPPQPAATPPQTP